MTGRFVLLAALCLAGCSAETASARSAQPEAENGRDVAPEASEAAKETAIPVTSMLEAPVAETVLRVAVVSDMNGRYGNAQYDEAVHHAVDRVVELSPDLVLTTGDMVAGQRAGLDYGAMWAGFHSTVTDRFDRAGIPFAVTPGNHDGSAYQPFMLERAEYVRQWSSRRPDVEMVDDTHYPLRYSFRQGPALFVSLDATGTGPLDAAQMRWLDRQLAQSDDPVKIVFGHVPLYPFTRGRERETIGDAQLENLLRSRGVDLFLSGHHHAYYPGRRGALRMVSMACLGGGPRRLIGTDSYSWHSIVTFEVTPNGVRSLDGFGGDTFDERVERSTLPPYVGAGHSRIDRDDTQLPSRPVPREAAIRPAAVTQVLR